MYIERCTHGLGRGLSKPGAAMRKGGSFLLHVIIGHSQLEKIPMSIERQRKILEEQLEEIMDGIAELKRNRGDNFSVKQLERTKKMVKSKLDKLNDQSR